MVVRKSTLLRVIVQGTHEIKGNIIISDSITGIRCIDLYGIDIPHLWLHATTRLKYGDLLKEIQTKYDDLLRENTT